MLKRNIRKLTVWSATPTPLSDSLKIDVASLKKTINHHVRIGVQALFLGGTCGEGPFLPRSDLRKLVTKACEINKDKLLISVQVTDNSHNRVLANIAEAKADGANMAIVAEPWFQGPWGPTSVLEKYYFETAERSVLPVGIYCRQVLLPLKTYERLFMHPNVRAIKDSTINKDMMNIAAAVGRRRDDIAVLTGYEFGMPEYLKAGYCGIVAGGGLLTGYMLTKMIDAAKGGDFKQVEALRKHCARILYSAYGGRKLRSWLTGFKYMLVKMGLFKSAAGYLAYPLPKAVRKNIDATVKREKDVLFP